MPHLTSRSGNVVAILFAPWTSTAAGRSTKVLWVWKAAPPSGPGDAARMSARLAATGQVVTRGLPEPYGPSSVVLPASGCWEVTITSALGTDTLDLVTR